MQQPHVRIGLQRARSVRGWGVRVRPRVDWRHLHREGVRLGLPRPWRLHRWRLRLPARLARRRVRVHGVPERVLGARGVRGRRQLSLPGWMDLCRLLHPYVPPCLLGAWHVPRRPDVRVRGRLARAGLPDPQVPKRLLQPGRVPRGHVLLRDGSLRRRLLAHALPLRLLGARDMRSQRDVRLLRRLHAQRLLGKDVPDELRGLGEPPCPPAPVRMAPCMSVGVARPHALSPAPRACRQAPAPCASRHAASLVSPRRLSRYPALAPASPTTPVIVATPRDSPQLPPAPPGPSLPPLRLSTHAEAAPPVCAGAPPWSARLDLSELSLGSRRLDGPSTRRLCPWHVPVPRGVGRPRLR